MAYSFELSQSAKAGGASLAGDKTYTASHVQAVSESIADEAVDSPIIIGIDVSAVVALFLVSTQDVTLTDGDAVSISLKANVPYVWTEDSYDSLLFTADVTVLEVSNASGAAATVSLVVLTDATPE
jgi:hypothetical protein